MKWISPLFSDARNKLGGTIYARNRAGVYQRARVTPTNPQTAFQQANREMFSAIVQAWRTLTPTQILGWNSLAESNTLTDSLGQTSMPSGFQLYTSRNRNRLLLGLSMLSNPPAAPSPAPLVQLEFGPFLDAGMGLDVMNFSLNTGTSVSTTHIIFGGTAPLSPGITFVAPHLYRTLGTGTLSDGDWDFATAWTAVFGAVTTSGLQVGAYGRFIHAPSGAEQARFTGLVTVADE
jgi:hypothetical protein